MDRASVTGTMPNRVAMQITPDSLRQVRSGHPWVYQSSIRSVTPEPTTGDFAVIFDQKRKFAAIGLYDSESAIAVRVLHRGAPQQIDHVWFSHTIQTAVARRELLHRDPATTAYRLIHGENDGLPGLVVDRYDTSLVLKVYSAAWLPLLPVIADCLTQFGDRAYLRLSRQVQQQTNWDEGQLLFGEPVRQPVEFLENGLRFAADLVQGHKTGHFLDQRENRQRIRALSEGKSVLDVFSCTGGFSVYAAAGGARSVTAIDISKPALESAKSNMTLNDTTAPSTTFHFNTYVDDAARAMGQLARHNKQFDLIVLDPPSYTSSTHHRERALHQYSNLTSLALQLLQPKGILFQASCSALISGEELERVITTKVAGTHWAIDSLEVFGQGLDHPISFAQGEYLHAVLLHLRDTRRIKSP